MNMIFGLANIDSNEVLGPPRFIYGVAWIAELVLTLSFPHNCTDSLTLKAILYNSSSCMISYRFGLLPIFTGGLAAIYIINSIWNELGFNNSADPHF